MTQLLSLTTHHKTKHAAVSVAISQTNKKAQLLLDGVDLTKLETRSYLQVVSNNLLQIIKVRCQLSMTMILWHGFYCRSILSLMICRLLSTTHLIWQPGQNWLARRSISETLLIFQQQESPVKHLIGRQITNFSQTLVERDLRYPVKHARKLTSQVVRQV